MITNNAFSFYYYYKERKKKHTKENIARRKSLVIKSGEKKIKEKNWIGNFFLRKAYNTSWFDSDSYQFQEIHPDVSKKKAERF